MSVLLGVAGLLGRLGSWLVHDHVKAQQTARTAPLIDEQYEVICQAIGEATWLLT